MNRAAGSTPSLEGPRTLTRALGRWGRREPGATDELWPLVDPELERLARARLARERRGHALEARALLHEAFVRLLEQRGIAWRSRRQFYHLASSMMRRVLLNHARDRSRAKRGGGERPLTWTDSLSPVDTVGAEQDITEALDRLAAVHPGWATVVRMRFYGGFRSREIADALGVSVPTVQRRWSLARAWLYRQMRGDLDQHGDADEHRDRRPGHDRDRDPHRADLRAGGRAAGG